MKLKECFYDKIELPHGKHAWVPVWSGYIGKIHNVIWACRMWFAKRVMGKGLCDAVASECSKCGNIVPWFKWKTPSAKESGT